MIVRILLCIVLGYGFGCISTGYLVGKAKKVDIRKYGSGNAGTTNALRTLGWKAGALTLLGDFIKAVIPILIARYGIAAGLEYEQSQLIALYTGLGVVFGHNYPFWLHFKGGKGIAATCGALTTFEPAILPYGLVLFAVIVGTTRYVSLGSLALSILIPTWIGIQYPGDYHMLIVSLCYTVSAFYTHRANIGRLIKGCENKIGQRVKVDTENKIVQSEQAATGENESKEG